MLEVPGPPTLFLLSPAKCGGDRGRLLIEGAGFPLAQQLHSPSGATIGEVFAWLSALYFRGKLAYSRQFARAPRGSPGVLVITPGAGLRPEDERLPVERLRMFAEVDVHHENELYVAPLLRDARALSEGCDAATRFVLLGSIASAKYLQPLQQVFGERLFFPKEFVGRGDMSRGGLLLRSAVDRTELDYVPVAGAVLRGSRPARLSPRRYRK